MESVDTFEHAGLEVRIRWEEFDQEHANPRDCDGKLGVMFCDYRGYSLGDEDAPDPRDQEVECDKCEGEGEYPCEDSAADDGRCTCEKCEGSGVVELSIIDYLKREHGARVILPLMVYEHSGITMRVGNGWKSSGQFPFDDAGWDTSLVGVIFDTEESRKATGSEWTDEEIEESLREEVRYYAAYLEGSVFGFEIVDEDDEVLDSCWGFLELNVWDDDAYVRTAAKEAAEIEREQIEREKAEALRWACADVVTV